MRIVLRRCLPFLFPFQTFITYPFTPAKTLPRLKTQGFLRFSCRAIMTSATSPPALAPVVEVKERIELTEIERKIFDRLLSTLRHFDLTDHHHLRVAGGWVRDKLLGKDCYDIDIALDNMLGSEFVEKVRDYLLSTGEEVQGVAVIPWYCKTQF